MMSSNNVKMTLKSNALKLDNVMDDYKNFEKKDCKKERNENFLWKAKNID